MPSDSHMSTPVRIRTAVGNMNPVPLAALDDRMTRSRRRPRCQVSDTSHRGFAMKTRPLRQLALVGSALLAATLTVVTPAAADPQPPAGAHGPGTANYGSFHPAGCNVATP